MMMIIWIFIDGRGSKIREEEEEVNDGVTVGFIYLPFHLLLFFGAGSFFIFLFY
jgi:hypothetical protein